MTPEEADRLGFDFDIRPREFGPVTHAMHRHLDAIKRIVIRNLSVEDYERALRDWAIFGTLGITGAAPAP